MASIKTSIMLQSNMMAQLQQINAGLGNMINNMSSVDRGTDEAFSIEDLLSYRSELEQLEDEMKRFNEMLDNTEESSFQGLTQGAMIFGNVMGNIITGIGQAAIRGLSDTINTSVEAYNIQKSAETQLAGVLKNSSENALGDFEKIKQKASEIQAKGIYGDEGMIAAGAEFATYFTDTDAIESMMDTLSNYAMGMSGGGALNSQQLVDYATNIAKITTGAYDAMTKKGFEVTDSQKNIINGTASEAELIAELGNDYMNMTEDMQKATIINSIIAESWDGLYETMSNTPEGSIIRLANAWGDLQEVMGAQIINGMQAINSVLAKNENWEIITKFMMGFAETINIVYHGIAKVIDISFEMARVIIDNWNNILPIVEGILVGIGLYIAKLAIAKIHTVALMLAQLKTAIIANWPIILVTGVVILIGYLLKLTGASKTLFGGITGGLNVVKDAFLALWNSLTAIISNIGIAFGNTIANVKSLFWGLLATATEVILGIAEKLNLLPFVNIDTKGLENTAELYRTKQQEALNSKKEYLNINGFENFNPAESFKVGASWGDNVVDSLSKKISSITNVSDDYISKLLSQTSEIADNTNETVNALNSSDDTDELAYYRDLAESEVVNRYTTSDIKIDLGGIVQNLNNESDANSLVDMLVSKLKVATSANVEGVYA